MCSVFLPVSPLGQRHAVRVVFARCRAFFACCCSVFPVLACLSLLFSLCCVLVCVSCLFLFFGPCALSSVVLPCLLRAASLGWRRRKEETPLFLLTPRGVCCSPLSSRSDFLGPAFFCLSCRLSLGCHLPLNSVVVPHPALLYL